MKKVIVLGSTGSIGRNTLEVIRKQRNRFKVIGLSTFKNTKLLNRQIEEFKPNYVSIFDKNKIKRFGNRKSFKIFGGEEGLLELSKVKSDILVLGISGLEALRPFLSSLGRTKRVLLANKEAIIGAGKLILSGIKKHSTQILPVDSEAWAVFNLLKCTDTKNLLSLYITASGGPFLNKTKKEIKNASIKEVLRHPVWSMGKRISVDSANLMNKGFEVMEVNRLFNVPLEKIKVLVHPQSAVHALLERKDRSLLSFLFSADMKIPISACLEYPKNSLFIKPLSLEKIRELEFFKPDYKKFPSLKLAYFVARKGKSYPAVLVSADEEAVSLYLKGKLKFYRIYEIVEKVVEDHRPKEIRSLEDIFFWEAWAKERVRQIVSKFKN